MIICIVQLLIYMDARLRDFYWIGTFAGWLCWELLTIAFYFAFTYPMSGCWQLKLELLFIAAAALWAHLLLCMLVTLVTG